MDQYSQLASKFCDSLGMSVILCRDSETADYRCLSSHLCGGTDCSENRAQAQEPARRDAGQA